MSHVDFDNLKFALYENIYQTTMYKQAYGEGVWKPGGLSLYHDLTLAPSANILNYGQGIFEGVKAYRTDNDRLVMFRIDQNAARFANSCRGFGIPPVPPETFVEACHQVVRANAQYVPPNNGGSCALYLRPVCIGTEAMLGVAPAKEYLFYIYVSPVGPYYSGVGVVRLIVTDIHRAAPHGTGSVKAVGNYPVTMVPKIKAKEHGYGEALYLDARHDRFVEEAGAANFFAVLDDNTLVTPRLGSILPGITRESILKLAADQLNMRVEERDLAIDEVCTRAKECFLSGTGATITSVSDIGWNGEDHNVNRNQSQVAKQLYQLLTDIQNQRVKDPYGWVVEVK